jgi:hypothetical protein
MRREQHALAVFERRVQRRILISEKDKISLDSRKLNSDGFYNFLLAK